MKGLIVLLVVCAFTAAMVPTPRDQEETSIEPATDAPAPTTICASITPCAWVVYNDRHTRILARTIKNTYCECGDGTSCQFFADDNISVEHRCKPVESLSTTTDSA